MKKADGITFRSSARLYLVRPSNPIAFSPPAVEIDGRRTDAIQVESVDQVHIQVAIAIGVEKTPSRSIGLDQEVRSGGSVGVDKGNSSPGRCVFEAHGGRFWTASRMSAEDEHKADRD